MDLWSNRRFETFYLLLMLAAALVLFLLNLGNHYLWQDEAQTALISKTILTDGIPKGYDGVNYLSQEIGAEYSRPLEGDYAWRWHTWLPFYVVAAFFKIFGVTTFTARLPFALFGIATVFMTYAFCRRYWKDRKAAFFSALLLLTSVPFLVLARQCRWYSLSTFFSMWGLYCYAGILEGRKRASLWFVISSFLLFHTHYLYCATLLGAVGLHALLFHQKLFPRVFILGTVVVLTNVPWIIWLAGMKYGDRYGGRHINAIKFVEFAKEYLRVILLYILTPLAAPMAILAAVGLRVRKGVFFLKDTDFWKKVALLLFFALTNLVALVVASPFPYFRYISPLVPALIVAIALLVTAAARLHFVVGIALVVAVMLFGALPQVTSPIIDQRDSGTMVDFLYEITHDFDGPNEGIIKYLNEHAEEGDIVLATYGDMPLKFYTGLRVIGGLTGEDLSEAANADWVVARKYMPSNLMKPVIDFFISKINVQDYERIILDYPDTPFENREEPEDHLFRTKTEESKVALLRRKK